MSEAMSNVERALWRIAELGARCSQQSATGNRGPLWAELEQTIVNLEADFEAARQAVDIAPAQVRSLEGRLSVAKKERDRERVRADENQADAAAARRERDRERARAGKAVAAATAARAAANEAAAAASEAGARLTAAQAALDQALTTSEAMAAARDEALAKRDQAMVAVEEAETCIGMLEARIGQLTADVDALRSERDVARAERDELRAERDAARAGTKALVAERDEIRAELEAARAERRAALAEREAALAEREAAHAERDEIIAEWDETRAERDAAQAERDALAAAAAAASAHRADALDTMAARAEGAVVVLPGVALPETPAGPVTPPARVSWRPTWSEWAADDDDEGGAETGRPAAAPVRQPAAEAKQAVSEVVLDGGADAAPAPASVRRYLNVAATIGQLLPEDLGPLLLSGATVVRREGRLFATVAVTADSFTAPGPDGADQAKKLADAGFRVEWTTDAPLAC